MQLSLKKTMDSDESYHSESEFYNPNEEDKEKNAARLYFRFIIYNLEINKNVIHRPWSVRIGKTVPSVSSAALGLRPQAVLETPGTAFPNTDLPAGE